MSDKVRIAIVSTFRLTDCNQSLIKLIDADCKKKNVSRVALIEELYGKKLETKQDVKCLQEHVRLLGFKTIEKWLDSIFKSK